MHLVILIGSHRDGFSPPSSTLETRTIWQPVGSHPPTTRVVIHSHHGYNHLLLFYQGIAVAIAVAVYTMDQHDAVIFP